MANQIFIVTTTATSRYDDYFWQDVKAFSNEADAREFFKKEHESINDDLRHYDTDEVLYGVNVIYEVNGDEATIVRESDEPEIWQVNFYSTQIN